MKKFIYALPLLACGLGLSVSASAETSDGYQMLPVHVEWKTQSLNFDKKKNLFPIPLPDNVTEGSEFFGVKGTFTTVTQKNLDSKGKDITGSETLFNLSSSVTGACPTTGEVVNSYQDAYNKYGISSYTTTIVKQAKAGSKSVDVNFTLSKGLPLKFGAKKCMFLIFDGSDFANKDYIMKADLEIKYKVPNPKPASQYALDGEFTATMHDVPSVSYVVYPVTKNGPSGTVPPGTLTSVFGNASMMNKDFPNLINWRGRNRVAVYKKGTCQEAFLNHFDTKFYWQDTDDSMHGLGHSIDWATTQVVSDMTLQGSGMDSVMKEMNGNSNLPMHLEDGDCVAHVIVNDGDPGSAYFNEETQTHFTIIPD